MAKSSPRKSLKSLFSRSESSPTTAVDKDEGEKKRFRFLRFRKKSNNASATEKPVNESQQVPVSTIKEDGEAWAENNLPESSKTSIYATAPRSKGKELSYSDLDLRKPKRFSTIAFGLRKKKKKPDEILSQSTFGIHSSGIEEQEEPTLDLSGVDPKKFSVSQPVLDTPTKFDIPSPPPVATNQSEPYFSLPGSSPISDARTKPKAEKPLMNGSDSVHVSTDLLKAPIATIPELQLDSTDSFEEKENIPVNVNLPKSNSNPPAAMTYTENSSAVEKVPVPTIEAKQPPVVLGTADIKKAVVDSVPTSNSLCEVDTPQQTKTEISLAETATVTLSQPQPDAPDSTDSATPNAAPSLAFVASKIEAALSETEPIPAVKADSAAPNQEVMIPDLEKSNSKVAESVTTTSDVRAEKDPQPVNHSEVYGALYESLFPQSFSSEVMESLSNHPAEIQPEIQQSETNSVLVVTKTFDECSMKSSVTYSSLPTSREFDSVNLKKDVPVQSYTNMSETLCERELTTTTTISTFASENSSAVEEVPVPTIEAKQPPVVLGTADIKKAVVDSVPTSNSLCEVDTPQQTKTEISLAETATVTLSQPQPDAPDSTDSATPSAAPSLAFVASKIEAALSETEPIPGVKADSAAPNQEVTIPDLEKSNSKVAESVTTTSDVSAEKDSQPVNHSEVYGALYESLFPQSFSSEVMASLSNHPAEIQPEIQQSETNSVPVVTKTFDECSMKSSVTYSSLPTSREFDSANLKKDVAVQSYTNMSETLCERELTTTTTISTFASYKTSNESETLRDPNVNLREPTSSLESASEPAESYNITYTELTHSLLEAKADSSALIEDSSTPAPVFQSQAPLAKSPAPPDSDYVTSQGTDTQVSGSKRRVILVKELVTDEASSVPDYTSPGSEKMDPGSKDLELKMETVQNFSSLPSGQLSGSDGVVSPMYLSVGSDDGSAVENYYSAEEDIMPNSGDEEMYSKECREDIYMGGRIREVIGSNEEDLQQKEVAQIDKMKTDDERVKVLMLKLQNVGINQEKEDVSSSTEVHHESSETSSPVDLKSQGKEVVITGIQVEKEVTELKEFVGQREDFSMQDKIAERDMPRREEEAPRVLIIKMQSVEGNEDMDEAISSSTEPQQQLRSQSSDTWTPVVLQGNDLKSQEKEVATTTLPQVEEQGKDLKEVVGLLQEFSQYGEITERDTSTTTRVVIVKMRSEENMEYEKQDISSPTEKELSTAEVPKVEEVAREVVKLNEEFSKQMRCEEREIAKGDEGGPSVVLEKLENEGNKEENKEIVNSRILEPRFSEGIDTNSQEKQLSTTEFPKAEEVVKEVVGLHEDFSKQVEMEEQHITKSEEVVIANLQNVTEREDIRSQTVVLPESSGTITSRFLEGNDAKTQVKESSTTEYSQVVPEVKEVQEFVRLHEEFSNPEEIKERQITKKDDSGPSVLLVQLQNEDEKEDTKENGGHSMEMQQQQRGNEFKTQEKEVANTAFPKVEERTTETKEVVLVREELSEKGVIKEKETNMTALEESNVLKNEASSQTKSPVHPQGKDSKSQNVEAATTLHPQVEEEVKVVVEKIVDTLKEVETAEEVITKKDEGVREVSSLTKLQQELRGQSSETKMSEFLEVSDVKSQKKEVATTAFPEGGQEVKREELLATPVEQVKTLLVCDSAPPSRKSHGTGEGAEANRNKALETEDPIKQQFPGQKIHYVANKDLSSSKYMQQRVDKDRITLLDRRPEELVLLHAEQNKSVAQSSDSTETNRSPVRDTPSAAKVVTGTLTQSTELQSDATKIQHNRAPQSTSEWADTITESTDRNRTVQEQVAVEVSALTTNTNLPDTAAAETSSQKKEHLAETRSDLSEGSLKASRTLTAASEVSASENQPTVADQELDDEMSSGYSSLSTKLSIRTSSPPKEEESRYRVHKLSLISESEGREDTGDSSKSSSTVTESNGSDVPFEYRWRNRFEGVTQYKPSTTEDLSSSNSLSYTDTTASSTISSSAPLLPEATAYKHADNALSSSSSSVQHITLTSRLSDKREVYPSHETDEWRRGLAEREEPVAPAEERESQSERGLDRFKSRWDSYEMPVSDSYLPKPASYDSPDSSTAESSEGPFTGVFKATLVELVSDPTPPLPSTPPGSPDVDSPNQFDMDSLVDTLKSMGPSMRPRNVVQRPPPQGLVSSLPPIVEDAPSPVSVDVQDSGIISPKKIDAVSKPAEPLKEVYTLPADIGLKRNTARDSRSPMELMKQQEPNLNLPLRASATNSIVMRTSPEDQQSPMQNGNGLQAPLPTSRLESSVIYGSYRAGSIDQKQENQQVHRPLFRTSSLPEKGLSNGRVSLVSNDIGDHGNGTELSGTRFERFSFLLNPTSSTSGSLSGTEDQNPRMSRPPSLGISSPPSSNSPTRLLSPTGSIDLHRQFNNTESPLSMIGQNHGIGTGMGMGLGTGMGIGMGMGMGMGRGGGMTPLLQRSFSSDGALGIPQTSVFNSMNGGSQFQSQEQQEMERNLVSKYRAFPDAYLTKEKEHGKLNPRPGKMYIFDQPGMCGQRIEVRSDVMDATSWELQETISIRVVRGGWVLYEKPEFKGEKIALDEGDIELTYPFGPPEEQQQNGQTEGEQQNGETSEVKTETKPVRRFIIGSLRRAVRDYSVPEISLFPEENAEGKKVIFRDTSEDARIFGFPIKANSIIINAGLWLVYAHPFFQGVPRVLEVGGYTNPEAWGVEKPYVGSLHPLKVGEPRVENFSEPKMVIYDKPYFTGKSRTITSTMRDFMTRRDRQQSVFMYSVGSLKVLGGIWVGYEKEGFRGNQYLLEEGEYHDWRVWGGCDSELRSVRAIRADLTDPLMVMFEQPEEDQEGMAEENTFEVTEAIADVELFDYKTSTRSIHVLNGAWIAYSHVDFSGKQYVLEKGFYNNCADWGSEDNRICSVQPILMAPSDNFRNRNEVILYSEPDFQGECHIFDQNQETLPDKLFTKSCRVSGGSWVIYEDQKFSGNLYVLSEGDYPNISSMGCPQGTRIRSVKCLPLTLSVPSISLFGLECLEGREITTDTEIRSMIEEGFNDHILSVRVNSGCWVICEHSNYRGRQFVLEPIEITNWLKFSSLQSIGSMFPVRQKRRFFRIKNKERGHYLSIQGGVEELKSGRVVVTPEVENMSDIWFYQEGFIKNRMCQTMSLQVMGNIEPAAKVVLWTETRQPVQTWTAKMKGLITSLTFPGMVLDVKGGKTYDKDHVVIMPENEERPSQQWEIELL